MTKSGSRLLGLVSLAVLAGCSVATERPQTAAVMATDPLAQGFASPPQEARPRTWWHWMNGNITKAGITKDLAWLKSVGMGGVQAFDASLNTPQVVDRRLVYMTPEWKDAFAFADAEAERLGLELAIASSPGWSHTGGPWVAPADAMKKLVWAETLVAGGKPIAAPLTPLPDTTGPFQSIGLFDPLHPPEKQPPQLSSGRPIAVLAVPVAAAPVPLPRLELEDGTPLSGGAVTDADLESGVSIPLGADRSGAVIARFDTPQTVRSLRVFLPRLRNMFRGMPIRGALEAQRDGQWDSISDVPLSPVPTTIGFDPVTASAFRLRLTATPEPDMSSFQGGVGSIDIPIYAAPSLREVLLAELRFSAEEQTARVEEKAGFETVLDYTAIADGDTAPTGPSGAQVIDLTSRLGADGSLDWTPPKGSDWQVLRFGWSLTGKTNHPATAEATGLEVDKFDGAVVRRYLETYLGKYRAVVGDDMIGKRGLRALLTDSIEVGKANWTPRMEVEFKARRGYDLRPWLPVLAGTVIGSPADSERFLFDWRQTLADLMADQHYGTVAKVAREQGLTLYGEALEDKRPVLGDDLAMRRNAAVPMAALWTWPKGGQVRSTLIGDMKGAASVAHVYGQRFVAAESMTSVNAPWDFAPHDLKPVIDLEFASGINRPVIHTSVHQPRDDMQPGLSLAIFGQYFNRHESWAPLARPWVDYLSRTSYLLQQGRNAAQVAWFIGEEAPVTALFAETPPAGLPSRHAYDFVNAAMLGDALKGDGAELVSAAGARYQALYLGGTSHRMTLPTLRRLDALVRGGLTLIGTRPTGTPSQADDAAEFARLADALWGGDTGKGRVIATADLDAGLTQVGIAPGLRFDGPGAALRYVERRFDGGRLFFVSNPGDPVQVTARFPITGKRPELWNAETGKASALSYRTKDGETLVPLSLNRDDALFVVFRADTAETSAKVAQPALAAPVPLTGPWQVLFQPGRGAPAMVTMDRLTPLEKSGEAGVRYFSGVASYSTMLTPPKGWKAGQPLWLDLGSVGDVAEVWLNGQKLGGLWRAPWRIDLGSAARPGRNALAVKVANKWVNRLIGDAQPGAQPVAKLAAPGYRPDAPLRPSGLIGPVRLLETGKAAIERK